MVDVQYDVKEIVKLLMKYMIEGLAITIAAYYIPVLFTKGSVKPTLLQIFTIGATAALVMAILDQYAAKVGEGVRHGAGLGIGFNMVGANPVLIPK